MKFHLISAKLQIPCTHDLSTPPHPTSKTYSLFLAARGRSKNLSIPKVMQKTLELTPPLHSLD